MSIAYIILAIVMALMAVASGVVKLLRNPRVVESIHNVKSLLLLLDSTNTSNSRIFSRRMRIG